MAAAGIGNMISDLAGLGLADQVSPLLMSLTTVKMNYNNMML